MALIKLFSVKMGRLFEKRRLIDHLQYLYSALVQLLSILIVDEDFTLVLRNEYVYKYISIENNKKKYVINKCKCNLLTN